MALNFSVLVYLPSYDLYARDIFITPVVSQPGQPAYFARGIVDTRDTAITTDIGQVVLSDQETIIDIREADSYYSGGVPVQGDTIEVPVFQGITDMVGTYEVTDAALNGGGEITLTVRKIVQATLIGPQP